MTLHAENGKLSIISFSAVHICCSGIEGDLYTINSLTAVGALRILIEYAPTTLSCAFIVYFTPVAKWFAFSLYSSTLLF